ncbi:MotE family protein [Thermodesulfobacteriota bacterium B35]
MSRIPLCLAITALLLFPVSLPLAGQETPAAGVTGGTTGTDSEKPRYSSVEERRLLVALQQERQNLVKEREALDRKKKELKRLEDEVDKKLDQLKKERLRLEELLAEKNAAEQKRIRDLSKMYEKMSPEKAARIFAELDQELAISLLANMKTKAAARILNNMNGDAAARLTTAFSSLDGK